MTSICAGLTIGKVMGETFYTSDRRVWRKWLSEHFETEKEVWFVFPMKASGEASLSYNDAVEEALCYGWIDSTIKHIDSVRRAQRFTPRRPNSSYSQLNIERLIWLDRQGLICPSVREKVLPVIAAPFVFPEDILAKLRRDEKVWGHFSAFSDGYKRIRIAYIDAARNRPAEFQKRLRNFLEKTREYQYYVHGEPKTERDKEESYRSVSSSSMGTLLSFPCYARVERKNGEKIKCVINTMTSNLINITEKDNGKTYNIETRALKEIRFNIEDSQYQRPLFPCRATISLVNQFPKSVTLLAIQEEQVVYEMKGKTYIKPLEKVEGIGFLYSESMEKYGCNIYFYEKKSL